MAHQAQSDFFQSVKDEWPEYFKWRNVIEVGSLDINGSVRPLFEFCNYVGFDVGPGPGVDYSVPGQLVRYPDESFDVAISAECFEHNPYWRETFENMVRMTKSGGLVTFTCAGEGRPEHGTARSDAGSSPLTTAMGWNYYENRKPEDFDDFVNDFKEYGFVVNDTDYDLYFWGIKK